jgi:hypothetical protein
MGEGRARVAILGVGMSVDAPFFPTRLLGAGVSRGRRGVIVIAIGSKNARSFVKSTRSFLLSGEEIFFLVKVASLELIVKVTSLQLELIVKGTSLQLELIVKVTSLQLELIVEEASCKLEIFIFKATGSEISTTIVLNGGSINRSSSAKGNGSDNKGSLGSDHFQG